jgi:two-component system sensor histidine kinase YesM
VENSIVHGVERNAKKTYLVINARSEKGMICIVVEDNGAGIAQEKLDAIHLSLQDEHTVEEGNHIGLSNVHQRINKLFGPAYGINLESALGIGTKVTLTIPNNSERENNHV